MPGSKALRLRALRLLARRSYARAELAGKLLPHALAALTAPPASQPQGQSLSVSHLRSPSGEVQDRDWQDREMLDREAPRPDRHDKAIALTKAQAQVQQVLDGLASEGLLNDRALAEAAVASKAARLGERRLRQVLQQKGLAQSDIQAALCAAQEGGMPSELERARALWQRRFGQCEPASGGQASAEHARQMRFLLARGFSTEVAAKVISSASRDAL